VAAEEAGAIAAEQDIYGDDAPAGAPRGKLRGKVNISHKAARDALGLPALESLLIQKRLRWVGHALRRAEGDASKAAVLYQLQHNKAGAWAKLVWADVTIMGWRNIKALQEAVSNRGRLHTADLPEAVWAGQRSLNLPALTTTPYELLSAAAAQTNVETDGVWFVHDNFHHLVAVLEGLPGYVNAARASELGFVKDSDVDAIAQQYIN
jgi:hypothetical protein